MAGISETVYCAEKPMVNNERFGTRGEKKGEQWNIKQRE